jgi:hypothetical protein
MQQLPDFSSYCERLCRHYWGDPTRETKAQLRWLERDNDYGGKSYDRGKRVWYDRGLARGGSTIELIQEQQGIEDFIDAWRWGHANGFIEQPPADIPAGIAATYDYVDETGALLFQTVRLQPKAFRQRRPLNGGGWEWRTKGVRQIPYRLPGLLKAMEAGRVVFVVEGEKDADTLARHDIAGTTNAMGAGKWRDALAEFFQGALAVIIQDNDLPGREHALTVYRSLEGVAERVRILDLTSIWPECPDKGDVSDWLERGGTAERLLVTADQLLRDEPKIHYGNGAAKEAPGSRLPAILSTVEFLASFQAPDPLVEGLIQRRFFYSMTGATGSGKTGVSLLLAGCCAVAQPFAGQHVSGGRVLYLAGENPTDVQMRWDAMLPEFGRGTDINVFFMPGIFDISGLETRIAAEVEKLGGVSLVIIDTAAAYFLGDEENSNSQLGAYARRLRRLTSLPGGPCIIANCHPVKNAASDNLIPRGGGAFIAEVDGNLTLARDDQSLALHWQGKFRGSDFDQVAFELVSSDCSTLRDSGGRVLKTVIVRSMSAAQETQRERNARSTEDALLLEMRDNSNASIEGLRVGLRWPSKQSVHRVMMRLKQERFVQKSRGRWELTEAGRKEAKNAATPA